MDWPTNPRKSEARSSTGDLAAGDPLTRRESTPDNTWAIGRLGPPGIADTPLRSY